MTNKRIETRADLEGISNGTVIRVSSIFETASMGYYQGKKGNKLKLLNFDKTKLFSYEFDESGDIDPESLEIERI